MEKNIDIAENDAKQYIVVKIGSEQYGIDISYIDNGVGKHGDELISLFEISAIVEEKENA